MAVASSTYLTHQFLPATWRRVREQALHTAIRGLVHATYRLRKTNLRSVPDGPAVLVCNHVSFADALIIGGAFRRPVRFVMDHRIHRQPALRWFFDAVGVIPIARAKDDPELLEQAYDRVAAALRRGELVCIFPEGMITHDGALNAFRDGIVRIIERTPVPVVPLALRGMWGSFFSRRNGKAMSGMPRRFWSKIELVAGRALEPSEVSTPDLQRRVQAMLDA
ncbi:MAG: 1-acyl-sn-glycerol-3-phosphate acyltransferase [Nannocystaceae bacterium]|nr:1-acyl-sn-glycerol-3-phosphate acyltransferase [bacterium]